MKNKDSSADRFEQTVHKEVEQMTIILEPGPFRFRKNTKSPCNYMKLLSLIRSHIQVLLALSVFSLISLAMLGFRMVHEDNHTFSFLVWNLFLAWIPLFTGLLIEKWVKPGTSGWLLFLFLGGFWLIFFPNSAYTDGSDPPPSPG